MPLDTALIDKGFNLASNFLSYLRERSQQRHEEKMAEIQMTVQESQVLDAIRIVAIQLDDAVKSIVKQVTEKIEKDNWEKLVAQVKGVQLALDLENTEMLQQAIGRITEQIEYAKNRLQEKKMDWLGPWLMAESIRLVAIRHIATTDRAMQLLERETKNFRINILDFGTQHFLSSGNVPWLKIVEFVEGRDEEIMPLIASASTSKAPAAKKTKAAIKTTVKVPKEAAPPSSTKTLLNPAVAWPFPSGTKRP